MKDLPICTVCQDEEKPSLLNTKQYGWVCDDCLVDLDDYDKNCEEHEERKRKKIFDSQEY